MIPNHRLRKSLVTHHNAGKYGVNKQVKSNILATPTQKLLEKIEIAHQLYPKDCYEAARLFVHGQKTKVAYLQDEHPLDMVAKLENADLAGMDIPWEFSDYDLLATYIPTRRTIAFAYSALRPGVGDNFSKGCKTARIPRHWYHNNMYRDLNILRFLSNFWRDRITAIQGIAYLYADKHSRKGSAPHLKQLTELTGLTRPNEDRGSSASVSITMPDPATGRTITVETSDPRRMLPA